LLLTKINVSHIKLSHLNDSAKGEEMMEGISLRQMQVNQTGTVVSVRARGELGRRIRDMGLVPGKDIRIQGRAPLKDPVSLRIMGGTLTLRNNEADYIFVEVH
jgi:ferrous iron transport protein A